MAAIVIFGLCLSFVGGLWLIVRAFGTSMGWGLGTLFVPFVSLFYAFNHWDRAKTPFLVHCCGIALCIVGIVLTAATATPTITATG